MSTDGIGIDFGTASTRVAIFRNGKPEIIPDVDGGDSFPSFVVFDSQNHTRSTGSKAKHQSSSLSSRVFNDIKGQIELQPLGVMDESRAASAEIVEAVAAIFDRAIGNVATHCKLSLETTTIRAVISVPALFNEHQRQIIRDAAKIVGIDILSLIATPSAICYAWALTERHLNEDAEIQTLALDMGAGLFHAAVATFEGGIVEMRAVYHRRLGGNDLEDCLYSYLKGHTKKQRIKVEPNSRAERRLRSACQKAIIELTLAQKYHIVLESLDGDKTFDFMIDRATFDEVAAKPITPSTLEAIDNVLHRSGTKKERIQEILVTGACSRIPLLRKAWTEHFGNKVRIRFLDHAEVKGCAMYLAVLMGILTPPKGCDFVPLLLQSMPLPIRVGLPSGECSVLFSGNSLIPNKNTEFLTWDKSLGLVVDQSPIERNEGTRKGSKRRKKVSKVISFYQGESSKCTENLLLMRVDLKDALSALPELQQRWLRVTIDVDAKGHIKVSVKLDPGPTITKALDLNRMGLTTHDHGELGFKLKLYRANDKLEEIRKAQRYTIDEKLAGLRILSIGLSQPREAIDREAFWLEDHPSASIESQQAMLQRLDALTELVLRYSKQNVEQSEGALLVPEAKRIEYHGTERTRDESVTVTPRNDHSVVNDNSCGTSEVDVPYRANEELQDGDAKHQPRGYGVPRMPSSYNGGDYSSILTRVEFESFFLTSSQGIPGIYTDANFARLSEYLRNTGFASWSATPRLYTALRLIDHVDALDEFLELEINDLCFPFTNATIPASISPTIKSAFLEIQETVYTESKSFDISRRRHVYFSKDDPKPFRTIGLLGKGGHATVDKVVSQLDRKEYARKLFRRVRGWPQNHIESFRTEINVLKEVDHVHCVELISTYSDPKYFAFLMKPAGDFNLARYYELARNNNDKLSLLRGFLGCLTSGVRYLHDSKIRHRDIKPQNVIIKDDQVYITDFGIAYSWENLAGATTTADSAKTAVYAAPEVIRVEPRNTSADIWSLGCIFFEIATLLSGGSVEDLKANFRQKSGTDAYHANVHNFPAWVNSIWSARASRPDSFSWTLARMALQVDAADRPTAAELFEEIVEETYRTGVHFCGPCCLDADICESEAGWYSAEEGDIPVE